ncbi:hypothetical protein DV515_00012650 [Chloebia gouldiae]|uniref:Uncharacterized protein n=1 Tax=Chloebia gouldiae TaxID=44316 RepID=A0A3L8S358_CHLGU|nr:hypothetical protein DV515_00012650 [Chloebia gouldiae]
MSSPNLTDLTDLERLAQTQGMIIGVLHGSIPTPLAVSKAALRGSKSSSVQPPRLGEKREVCPRSAEHHRPNRAVKFTAKVPGWTDNPGQLLSKYKLAKGGEQRDISLLEASRVGKKGDYVGNLVPLFSQMSHSDKHSPRALIAQHQQRALGCRTAQGHFLQQQLCKQHLLSWRPGQPSCLGEGSNGEQAKTRQGFWGFTSNSQTAAGKVLNARSQCLLSLDECQTTFWRECKGAQTGGCVSPNNTRSFKHCSGVTKLNLDMLSNAISYKLLQSHPCLQQPVGLYLEIRDGHYQWLGQVLLVQCSRSLPSPPLHVLGDERLRSAVLMGPSFSQACPKPSALHGNEWIPAMVSVELEPWAGPAAAVTPTRISKCEVFSKLLVEYLTGYQFCGKGNAISPRYCCTSIIHLFSLRSFAAYNTSGLQGQQHKCNYPISPVTSQSHENNYNESTTLLTSNKFFMVTPVLLQYWRESYNQIKLCSILGSKTLCYLPSSKKHMEGTGLLKVTVNDRSTRRARKALTVITTSSSEMNYYCFYMIYGFKCKRWCKDPVPNSQMEYNMSHTAKDLEGILALEPLPTAICLAYKPGIPSARLLVLLITTSDNCNCVTATGSKQ